MRRGALGACLMLTMLGAACGDDDGAASAPDAATGVGVDPATAPTGTASDAGVAGIDAGTTPPLYLISTTVTTPEGSNTYVKSVPSLGALGKRLDLTDSREFPGWADVNMIGGRAYVSSADEPKVTRFKIDERGALVEDGVIHFGVHTSKADISQHHVISPTKAYLVGEKSFVVWNPTTLEVTGTIPLPPMETRRGDMTPNYAYDRGSVVRGNRLFIAASWLDWKTFRIEPDSRVVVLDTDNDRVVSTLVAPCPFLEIATKDENEAIYFSSWTYQPAATVGLGEAKGCAVKIPAGSEAIDASWTLPIAEATGGHEGSALVAIGGGKALMTVFHEENAKFDRTKDQIRSYAFGSNWTFAIVDLASRKVERELTELGFHEGSYYTYMIDGKLTVLTPKPNAAGEDGTTYYQIDRTAPSVTGIEMPGWSTRAFRVR
ncbi:MAG: hypothetical protein ABW252_02535 [Polyangiales bacterium]